MYIGLSGEFGLYVVFGWYFIFVYVLLVERNLEEIKLIGFVILVVWIYFYGNLK